MADHDPAHRMHARPAPDSSPDPRDRRVLVVDDDPTAVPLLRRCLAEEGYRVEIAKGGAEALDVLRASPPPVLITDWMMPGINGLELCRRIRAEAATAFIYVIVLTARTETNDLIEAFEAGADDYLSKPFNGRELLARVRAGQRIAQLVRTTSRQQHELSERERSEAKLSEQRHHLERLVDERGRELLEAERQLLQNERLASVGQLAAGVAHEINTPIQYVGDNLRAMSDFVIDLSAVVQAYRELIALVKSANHTPQALAAVDAVEQERDLDYILQDAPRAIEQGLEGVERVAHIVRAMKDFSHVNREEVSSIDVNRALENTLTVARNEYKYVADVETDFGELPFVQAYAGELRQVFLNLIVNAAHAIGETGRRGKMTLRTRADKDCVEITIADTGCGIPDEVRDRVFDPFFTTKAVGKGTGQGLTIAHQIVVRKHGGTLTFESDVGEGTTFRIRLPLQVKSESAAQQGAVSR